MKILIENFQLFITQLQSPDLLFWCKDDPYLPGLQIIGNSYGFHCESAWKISEVHQEGFKVYFDITHKDKHFKSIELALSGKHNVLNATAVFGLAYTLGVSEENIRRSFQTFQGVLRRCQQKGIFQEIDFIDDYAHHPTEIETTLQGIRNAIGDRRLIAVFQPHRYTRIKDCLGSYRNIFDAADLLIITDIYGAGEAPINGLTPEQILSEIKENSKILTEYISRSDLSCYLTHCLRPGDVVITLGAGDITKLSQETLLLLENTCLMTNEK